MITADQIRAARALKGWSQSDLAKEAGVATPSIANIELGKQKPSAHMLENIKSAFDMNGIEFRENEGVQKKSGHIRSFYGQAGFLDFMNDVDDVARKLPGSEFLVTNVDERKFSNGRDPEFFLKHKKIILDNHVRYKIIIKENDFFRPAADYAEYRWVKEDRFESLPLYIYGDRVAMIAFEEGENVNVFVIQHPVISALCRKQFMEIWNRTIEIPDEN